MPVPCRRSFAGGLAKEQIFPGQAVEVEAAERQDRIVQPVLLRNGPPRHRVKGHDAVVVRGMQGVEKACGNGEEGDVLDIRVMFGRIGHDVMYIVVPLPPADGQAANEVGDENAKNGVGLEVVRYAHVAGVVDCEDQLVPQHA